ncbi:MAG TPA: hypothetical protein VJZ71_16620 [Phycisphaerae bacterium]|nr:hypothetical protein [Phycisphaerae bacterium]
MNLERRRIGELPQLRFYRYVGLLTPIRNNDNVQDPILKPLQFHCCADFEEIFNLKNWKAFPVMFTNVDGDKVFSSYYSSVKANPPIPRGYVKFGFDMTPKFFLKSLDCNYLPNRKFLKDFAGSDRSILRASSDALRCRGLRATPPFPEYRFGKTGCVAINQCGTCGAQPDRVIDRTSLLLGFGRVVSRASRRRRRDVRRDANIYGAGGVCRRAAGQPLARRIRTT